MKRRARARFRDAIAGLLTGAACTAGAASAAQADEISVDGKTLQRVQVVGYEHGEVQIHTATGEQDRFPLRDVEYIVLDSVSGVADFNSAEELMVKREPAQAVERYERAVRAARGFWASMARVRLVMAADAAGDLERAVRAWLDVVAEDPATAAELLPQATPSPRDQANERTRKRLEKAMAEQSAGDAQTVTVLLYYDVLRRTEDPAARVAVQQVAESPLPVGLMTARTVGIKLAALRTQIDGEQAARAVAGLDGLIADAPEEFLPEILILKAQALLQTAQDERAYLRAALPAMRVVVHFPDHPLVGEGLLLAGEAHAAAGRKADAERLLRACLRHGDGSERVLEEARGKLAALAAEGG